MIVKEKQNQNKHHQQYKVFNFVQTITSVVGKHVREPRVQSAVWFGNDEWCSKFTEEDDGDVKLLFFQYSGQQLRGIYLILPANRREMSPTSFAITSPTDCRQVETPHPTPPPPHTPPPPPMQFWCKYCIKDSNFQSERNTKGNDRGTSKWSISLIHVVEKSVSSPFTYDTISFPPSLDSP